MAEQLNFNHDIGSSLTVLIVTPNVYLTTKISIKVFLVSLVNKIGLSEQKCFPIVELFCQQRDPFFGTPYPDLIFLTFVEGFYMNDGRRKSFVFTARSNI